MAYLDIDCAHVTSIDPSTNRSLTVSVNMTKAQAESLVLQIADTLFSSPIDFANWFKDEFSEIVKGWQEDAVEAAAEAYQERRNEKAMG